jgi:hypothetical protein
MIKQDENTLTKHKKSYNGSDVIEAAKEMLRSDDIGKKLPDDVLEKLSRLLAKTALKGDL